MRTLIGRVFAAVLLLLAATSAEAATNYTLYGQWTKVASAGQTVTLENFGTFDIEYQQSNTPTLLNPVFELYLTQSVTLNLTQDLYAICLADGLSVATVVGGTGGGGGTQPVLAAPGQVAAVTSTAQTTTTLSLAWAMPTYGGTPADYLVSYRVTGTQSFTPVDQSSTGLTGTLTGLTPGTSYDVAVDAINAAGMGPYSPLLVVSTTGAAPAPSAPGQVASVTSPSQTSSSVSLAWSAPSGSPTDYLVGYRVTGQSTFTIIDEGSTALAASVPGLTASTSYDFEVAAKNGVGTGTYSSPLTVSTTAPVVTSQAGGGPNNTADGSDPNNSYLVALGTL